ncbi:MAG: hypothetical protein B6I30_06480 [Desulfobacteraceae bacterium 4572_187]|nr:MAG: hypothetical protein B6I30_06480 [Desulfobacteraceae bacterium 4572_187]
MAEESSGEKTEKPTPKKRQELREKGEVAKSRELPSVAVLMSALIALSLFGSFTYSHIQLIMKGSFSLPTMNDLNISEFLVFAQQVTVHFILALCPLLAAIFITAILSNIMQIIDYAFQKWEFENRNKMTKQEVKDEFKRTEGDPLIKSRIKSIQMEMARKRMMQAVPEADVVITNPTHFAAALKYDSSTMNAPKLIAKGAGKIAEKIKKLAEEHDIPIVENRELARNLNSLVEIGQEIPQVLFQAVAEILAYIYKIRSNYLHGLA